MAVTGSARRISIAVTILVAFAALLVWKTTSGPGAGTDAPLASGTEETVSITSVHNDAVADFEAALDAGQPVYVLFHSLSCAPCVEISEVADTVVPEYAGMVTFVNVISDDPSGRELARHFEFQYIPTSFFLAPDGAVVDSFTGAMDETEMRARLDSLLGEQ